jgi:hypothetical protein
MNAQLPEGKYEATITDQRFDETKTGKLQFVLGIDVEGELVGDRSEPLDAPKRRTIYRVIEGGDDASTQKLLDWFRSTAKHLGFDAGDRRLSDLDPNAPANRHHSFIGQTVVVKCRHESYNGSLQERWDVFQPRATTPINGEKMERLDALFGQLVGQHEDGAPAPALNDMSQEDFNREVSAVGDDEIPF